MSSKALLAMTPECCVPTFAPEKHSQLTASKNELRLIPKAPTTPKDFLTFVTVILHVQVSIRRVHLLVDIHRVVNVRLGGIVES